MKLLLNSPRLGRSIGSLLVLLAFWLAPAATASITAPEGDEEFDAWKKEFERAMSINAKQDMARLVRTKDHIAVQWVLLTCEKISEGSSDELEDFIAALGEAWVTARKTKFVRMTYEYFSLMDPVIRRERGKLIERYNKAHTKYTENLTKKDGPTFGRLSNDFENLASAFEEIGDRYYISQSWYVYAECWVEANRGADANNFKACAGYKAMLENRDKIELKDRYYLSVEAVYKELKAKGFDQDEEAAKAKGGPGPGVVAATASTAVKLGFERIDSYSRFERPSFYMDELFPVWNSFYLAKTGSTFLFDRIKSGLTLHRDGANEVTIDTDSDGKGDVQIPITGNVMPVEVEVDVEGKRRPWAFLAVVGNQQSTFQGLTMNLGPSDDSITIYVVSAASVVGEVDGTPIRIIDDSMDGLYGNQPQSWGQVGLTKGMFQPEIDSVVIGNTKRAVPWSEFLKVGEQWYHFEPQQAGEALKATPVEVETGTLQLKFKGGKPSWFVVQGTGQFENSYFDVVGGGNKVEVPAGYYKLCFGELRKGKKQQAAKALILGPELSWKVEEGKTTEIELGAPFKFDFDFTTTDETITVEGTTVSVIGSGNERYQRLWNCVARPEAAYRKAGARKGGKPKKMRLVESQEQITEIGDGNGKGWAVAWFPLDITLTKKKSEEKVEVQLFEKKNKLFGKITSDWKD